MIAAIAFAAAVPLARADITMMDRPPRRRSGPVFEPQLQDLPDVASVIAASSIDHDRHPAAADLDVPLVGPWLALANWGHCSAANPGCISSGDKVLLVADGLAQAAGVMAILDGLFWPRTRHNAQDTSLHVKPTTNGMAIFAHF